MNMQKAIRRAFPYILILLCGFLLLLPLFHSGFILTDDGNWMVIRLSAFYQSLREGQFPVRFLGRLNHGYGYPVANFLYPGFLYIGSLLRLLDFSFVNIVKVIFGLSLLSSGVGMYLWLKRQFNTVSSIVGSLSYMAAPYMLFDIYKRGSVGEVLALGFVPISLYAIDGGQPWLFTLSVILLILAHNSLALIFLLWFILYLFITKRLNKYFVWMALAVGATMFFWFPALHEQKYVVFSSTTVSNPFDYFVSYGSIQLLGIASVLAGLGVLIAKIRHPKKIIFLLSFLLGIFLALPVSGFFWKIPLMNSLFQFPFRFLSLSLFAGSWLLALCMQNGRKIQVLIVFGILFFPILYVLPLVHTIQYQDYPDEYYTTNEATTTVQDEYMTKWVTVKPVNHADQRIIFYQGRGTFDIKKISTQYVNVIAKASEDSIIQINIMYYPGWGVTVDGVPVTIEYQNENGVIQFPISKGDHQIMASFRETISRFIADNISLVVFVIYFIMSIRYVGIVTVKKNQNNNRK